MAFEAARIAVDLNRPFSGYAFTAAFPGVTFDQPVGIATAPGETNRLFVIERKGVICVITNLARPTRTVFLDLRERTAANYIESGLLGLAFHPNYKENGYFFVFRTIVDGPFKDRLSRFRVSPINPNVSDPQETVLIDQVDVADTHNAGDLHFGPDGYLYLSVGDEGPTQADRGVTKQAIDGGLFGGILRIDVDQRPGNLPPNQHPSVVGHYSIPADNPYIGATSFLGQTIDPARVRTEFYAVGMRNPWRFSFDPTSGALILADVGLGWVEEINIVKKGGNYGWPYFEGTYLQGDAPVQTAFDRPVHEYPRGRGLTGGNCVIGGIVVRNATIEELEGHYVFADHISGNVWKMNLEDHGDAEWIAREFGLTAIGRDPATGDVLAASIMRGEIRRLIYVSPEEQRIPTELSKTGIFADLTNLTPSTGIVPFEINVPFWSDHALKTRWFGLTDTNSIMTFSETGNWDFPHGSVWVKHFELESELGNAATARRIETRLLLKSGADIHGFTYRWTGDGREGHLVPASGLEEDIEILDIPAGIVRTQRWIYPPRGDCVACHTKQGGGALGFHTAQLNLNRLQEGVPKSQLQMLADAGYIDRESVESHHLPALAKASDLTVPVEFRVKSYLAANCVSCHQPGGVWATFWDARWSTPMDGQNLVGFIPGLATHEGAKLIDPLAPTNSALFRRISESEFKMPPIGSTMVDEGARQLLTNWILTMPDKTFIQHAVGKGTLRGSVAQREGIRVVSGIGRGIEGNNEDRLHLVGSTLKGNGHVVARIRDVPGAQSRMKAGVMIRQSAAPDSAAAWVWRQTDSITSMEARADDGGRPAVAANAASAGSWLRVIRNGHRASGWQSDDGVTWSSIGEADFLANDEILAGAAVSSGEDWRYATVEFENLQVVSLSLTMNDPSPGAPLPREMSLRANVEANGVTVRRVDFYADGELVGTGESAPWTVPWTNPWPGSYSIVATATDQNGLTINSAPTVVNFAAGAPLAREASSSSVEPNWSDGFGRSGMEIPGVVRELPMRTQLEIVQGALAIYPGSGLLRDGDGAMPATAWVAEGELRILYRPGDASAHRLTLFFADYENGETQTIRFTAAGNSTGLEEKVVRDYEDGRFFSYVVRGEVEITIASNAGVRAHLSGVFIDPLPPVMAQISPVSEAITLPSSILLQAEAHAEGRDIQRIEFWAGDRKIGEDITAPYECLWRDALAGEYSLTVWAVDEFGLRARSTPMAIDVRLPDAAAHFICEDHSTKGDWIGTYGGLGYVLPAGATNLPSNYRATTTAGSFMFEGWDTNRASLLWPESPEGRFAACYFVNGGDTLQINAAALHGRWTRFGLYFFDRGGTGRAQEVELFDEASGVSLDRRTLESFSNGVYLVWNIQGNVRVAIRSLNDYNVIVNAIFFDPPAPEVKLTTWPNDRSVTLPLALTLRADVIGEESLQRVEFYADQQRIGSVTNVPFEFVWTNMLAEEHTLFARGVGHSGNLVDSPSITLTCNLPTATAAFVRELRGIGGDWWKAFGADGFQIPTISEQLRENTRITHGPLSEVHEWPASGDDVRGAFAPDDQSHLPVAWRSDQSYDIEVGLIDGREHLLAMYFVDFERVGAAQSVRIKDAVSEAILDERLVEDMGEGVYFAWNVRGRVRVEIERQTTWASLISGIFLGGPIVSSQFWWAEHFGGDLLATPKWHADPDGDSRVNMVEYAVGSDPMAADEPVRMTSFLDSEALVIDLNVRQAVSDAPITLETSSDLATWRAATVTRADIDEHVRFTAPVLETANFYRLRFAQP